MARLKAPKLSKTAIVVLIVVVLLGGAVAARAVRVSARRAQNAASLYSTAEVVRGTLEVTVTGTGTLRPVRRQVSLASSGGTVEEVRAKPGDQVKAGDVLLVLSSDSLLDQAERARLEYRLAELDYEAMTQPQESLASDADVAAARAAVAAARVARDKAKENADDLAATAPFAGRVTGIEVSPGDEVAPGTALFTVTTPSSLKVILSVPEADIEHYKIGAPATVTVEAAGGADLDGEVTSISDQGTAGDRGIFYTVVIVLSEYDPACKGGMTAAATVKGGDDWDDEYRARGTLAYEDIETVVTRTGGTVESVSVREGQDVEAGQLIMTLTNDDTVAALAKAEADLAKAEEALADLVSPGAPSYTQAQIEKQRIRLEEASQSYQSLRDQVDDLTVKADFDGTVTDVPVAVGDEVAPNQRLVSVADFGSIEAVITVDELEVANLAAGQTAVVRIDALPGESFTGTLDYVSLEGSLSDGVTSYEVRITLPGDPRMRAGMSLSATIEVARRENALLIPVESVYGTGKEATVQVLVDGKPAARQVTTGLSNDTYVEILSGLGEGETVVTGTLDTDQDPFMPSGMGHPGGGRNSGAGEAGTEGGSSGGGSSGGGSSGGDSGSSGGGGN